MAERSADRAGRFGSIEEVRLVHHISSVPSTYDDPMVSSSVATIGPTLTVEGCLSRLAERMREFADAASLVRDWDSPVAACPNWSVGDLVVHLGSIHEWAGQTPGRWIRPGPAQRPESLTDPATWYRGKSATLLQILTDHSPNDQAWTLWGPPTLGFWARRQLHETTIHLHDLVSTLASEGIEAHWRVDDAQALDGIDEVLTGFYPRQIRLGRAQVLPGVIRLDAVCSDGLHLAWSPRLGPTDAIEVIGTIGGSASQLYLALWNRAPFPVEDKASRLLKAARLVP